MTLSRVVSRVIALSKAAQLECDDWNSADLPGRGEAEDPFPLDLGPKVTGAAVRDQLRQFLRQQSAATVYALAALVALGREQRGLSKFLTYYELVSNTFQHPDDAISQMLAKGAELHVHLASALSAAQAGAIDALLDG